MEHLTVLYRAFIGTSAPEIAVQHCIAPIASIGTCPGFPDVTAQDCARFSKAHSDANQMDIHGGRQLRHYKHRVRVSHGEYDGEEERNKRFVHRDVSRMMAPPRLTSRCVTNVSPQLSPPSMTSQHVSSVYVARIYPGFQNHLAPIHKIPAFNTDPCSALLLSRVVAIFVTSLLRLFLAYFHETSSL
jgi:hypothetical protein